MRFAALQRFMCYIPHVRNLCIDGGFDICAEMFNKNILAPLKTFVPKVATTSKLLFLVNKGYVR